MPSLKRAEQEVKRVLFYPSLRYNILRQLSARPAPAVQQGANPFFDYQVPTAVITLKQGFGRLIRSLEDRGLLVLLDPRIERQRYGKVFLESLPPYRLTRDIGEVENFFAGG